MDEVIANVHGLDASLGEAPPYGRALDETREEKSEGKPEGEASVAHVVRRDQHGTVRAADGGGRSVVLCSW